MANLKAILEEAGGSFENVVKTTVLLDNMADFAAVNTIYGAIPLVDTNIRFSVYAATATRRDTESHSWHMIRQ